MGKKQKNKTIDTSGSYKDLNTYIKFIDITCHISLYGTIKLGMISFKRTLNV